MRRAGTQAGARSSPARTDSTSGGTAGGSSLAGMPTIFTRIIDGEMPGMFVWRDPECVAFLSINPMHTGHTLVVPRAEVDHWIDLDPELAAHLFQVAQTIGQAQRPALSPAASA